MVLDWLASAEIGRWFASPFLFLVLQSINVATAINSCRSVGNKQKSRWAQGADGLQVGVRAWISSSSSALLL